MTCRLSLVLTLAGCSSGLPLPETTEHPLSRYVEVPYPPPAALAETVPERPDRDDVVWIGGEWRYHGRGFIWRRGGWVVAPQTGRFAPWHSWYRRDGRLMLAPGAWYDARGQRLWRIEPVVPSTTPPNEITSEHQTGR